MGKAENIKRAKKLKEARRKREQDALIKDVKGPASKILVERNKNSGFEIRLNNGKVKYSELLKKFADPIINSSDDISIIRSKYIFCSLVWNTAILRDKSDELFQSVKKDILNQIPIDLNIEELFDEMVKRKLDEFSEYKNFFRDIEIRKIRGLDYDLTVSTFSQ